MTDNQPKMSIADYAPILTFVISFFLLHFFEWRDSTYFVISIFISFLTYNYEVYLLKQEWVLSKDNLKKTAFHSGLLLLLFFILLGISILDWFRIIAISWRMGLLYGMVVVYMTVLFRVINTLFFIRVKSVKK